MAKIKKLPGLAIINGFKGTLDFYLWMGIACVRTWPRSPGRVRTPAVMAQWEPFAWASAAWTYLDEEVRRAYEKTATGTNLSARDLFTKNFISSTYLELE